MTSEDGFIQVEGFSTWFGATRALSRVTFDVPPRSVTALIGPSGSGKTTLLRALNRLNELIPGSSFDGRVLLDGRDIYGTDVDTGALRQRVGMVFQRPNPFPKSVFDNVAYGPRLNARLSGAALEERVERSLRRAALWEEARDRLRTSALELSAGQQQRLCIARALANEPEVLLLDEPTSALDPIATQRIEELLYELRTQLTIVLVTHNLQQAARVSGRTVFLADGAVVEVGDTARIFTSPREARTEAFITGRFG